MNLKTLFITCQLAAMATLAAAQQVQPPLSYAERIALPADNTQSSSSERTDLWGEENHNFTPTSKPAMRLNMYANGSLASTTGGAGTLNKPVTDITLNDDGTASLWYVKAPDPELMVTPSSVKLNAQIGNTTSATFWVKGVSLPENIVLTLNDETGLFAINKTEFTPDQAVRPT